MERGRGREKKDTGQMLALCSCRSAERPKLGGHVWCEGQGVIKFMVQGRVGLQVSTEASKLVAGFFLQGSRFTALIS